MNRTIYFDEAGNTGQNLLDSAQPFHVLISHNFTHDETAALLKKLKEVAVQANELHFKNLKKSHHYQQLITKLVNDKLISNDRIYYSVTNKSFVIIGQMVDQLMEPFFESVGSDIYKSSQCLFLTNYIYLNGQLHWDKAKFGAMCSSFVSMMRNKDSKTIDEFYVNVFDLYQSIDSNEDKSILFPLLLSKNYINDVFESVTKYTMDITLSNFFVHCNEWGKRLNENLIVILDHSKQIEYYSDYIDYITKNIPPAEVGYGSNTMKFPIPIEKLILEDSSNILEIQLADIMVSCINYGLIITNSKKITTDSFANAIMESRLLDIPCHTIWPNASVSIKKMKEPGADKGQNILDYLADMAKQRKTEYEKVEKLFRRAPPKP